MKDTNEIESMRQQLAEKDAEIERLNASPTIEACRQMIRDKAVIEASELHKQLAASQAREQQLRAHLEVITGKRMSADNCLGNVEIAELAIALPQDTTALSAMVDNAGIKYFIAGAEYAYSSISGGDGMTITEKEAEEAIRANMDVNK